MCFAQPSFCIFEWCDLNDIFLVYKVFEQHLEIFGHSVHSQGTEGGLV